MRGGRALLLCCLVACENPLQPGGGSAASPAAPLPPPLAALGDLARPTDIKTEKEIPPEGGVVPLSDGASLVVSLGAVPGRTWVVMQRVDLALDLFVTEAKASWAYVIVSDVDVPRLGAPVTLLIPRPPEAMAVAKWNGTSWVPEPLAAGPVTRVTLDHFSTNVVLALERKLTGMERTAADWTGPDPQSQREARWVRERGNPSAQAFHGVGDRYTGNRDRLCLDFYDALRTEATTYQFPPGANRSVWELGEYLHAGNAPSDTRGNYYWRRTVGSRPAIERMLLDPRTPAPVTPARMLGLCIRANGGSAPLGVLACHNFLKDVTYTCRLQHAHEMDERCGRIAARLQTWRSGDVAPSGALDKMGPLYHVFAAMTAGVWFPGKGIAGAGAAVAEAALRALSVGADRPDPEKGQADTCGARVGFVIRFPDAIRDYVFLHGTAPPPTAQPLTAAPTGTAAPTAGPTVEGVEAWLGRWRGPVEMLIGGRRVAAPQESELVVTRLSKTAFRVRPATRVPSGGHALLTTMDLELDPENPAEASGRGSGSPVAIQRFRTTMTYEIRASLREGRMHLHMTSHIVTTGPMAGRAGTSSETVSNMILDRVE